MEFLRVADFSSGFQATEANAQMLYERCIADSSTDSDYIYRARCRDISEFGARWDFSNDFHRKVEIAINPSKQNSVEPWFYLIESEVLPDLQRLFQFPCSHHSPLKPSLNPYSVPSFLWGHRSEQSPYLRVASRLKRKGNVLLFDGYFDFQKSESSVGGPVGRAGTIAISIHLPRFDYLSEYLKKYL